MASAKFVVIAEVNGILFSEYLALDDYKPLTEVWNPQRAVLDVTIKEVIAARSKLFEPVPVVGAALLTLGVSIGRLALTPYPALVGQEVVFLLGARLHSRSRNQNQPPIYFQIVSPAQIEKGPIPLGSLNEVIEAARSAGFVQSRSQLDSK